MLHQHVDRTGAGRGVRRAAPPAPHDGAGHGGRGPARGVADGGGVEDQAGGRGAWAAGGQAVLPRCRVAGTPGGPRAVSGGGWLGPPGAMVGPGPVTVVARALGRAHADLPGDGGRLMSDTIRLSGTT